MNKAIAVVAVSCGAGLAVAETPREAGPELQAPAPASSTIDGAARRALCPAANASHLGVSRNELRRRAAAAAMSDDPLCALRGDALADWLDREGLGACAAAARLTEVVERTADADLAALASSQLWRCGRPREAHALALAALKLDDTSLVAWHTLAFVLQARWREPQARAAYLKALALDPSDPTALIGVADTSVDRAERRDALARYLAIAAMRGEPYQRIRGAREALDFLRVLADTPVWIVEREELPGAIPYTVYSERAGRRQGLIATCGLGNEQNVPVLLDSGASGLHLSPTIEKKIGFRELVDATLIGGGGDREHAVRRGLVPRVDFGPIVFRDGLGTMAASSLHPIGIYRAIAGVDLLGGLQIAVARGENRAQLSAAVAVSDDPDPRAAEPWPNDRSSLPILRVEGQLLVPVTLSSPRGWFEGWMVFDTGASSTMIDYATAEQFGDVRVGGAGEARGYGGAVPLSGRLSSARVALGTWAHPLPDQPVIDLSERTRIGGVAVAGFLGLDVIGDATFTLDLGQGTLTIGSDDER
ncbi:MAG: hypothetical protein U0V87_13880 [Acidobacteriota bacterium]